MYKPTIRYQQNVPGPIKALSSGVRRKGTKTTRWHDERDALYCLCALRCGAGSALQEPFAWYL